MKRCPLKRAGTCLSWLWVIHKPLTISSWSAPMYVSPRELRFLVIDAHCRWQYDLLDQWTQYLIEDSLIPANQYVIFYLHWGSMKFPSLRKLDTDKLARIDSPPTTLPESWLIKLTLQSRALSVSWLCPRLLDCWARRMFSLTTVWAPTFPKANTRFSDVVIVHRIQLCSPDLGLCHFKWWEAPWTRCKPGWLWSALVANRATV